ncbi:MAG: hypothetical protein ACOWW1_05065 [archaeon]
MSSSYTRMVNGFEKSLIIAVFNSKMMADFGCGFGRWAHIIKSDVDRWGNNAFLVSCDAFQSSLNGLRIIPFKEDAFDITIAYGLIEHMEKNGRKQVICFKNSIAK